MRKIFLRMVPSPDVLFVISLMIVVLVVFLPLTKTFYQQDEWLGFGGFLANGFGYVFSGASGVLSLFFAQGRILSNLIFSLFVNFFPLNILPFAIFAIFFHSVNVILTFLLIKKLFKKSLPAFLGSLFLAVSSVSQNSVAWAATSTNTLPSATLILLALLFYFEHLKEFKQKWSILCFVFVYLSLFFKETGIFLLLLFPFFILVFKRVPFFKLIKSYWYYLLVVALIVIFRLSQYATTPHQEALFLTGSSKYFFDSLIVRSILYPLTSFSLSLVPPTGFLNFARYITNVYYPFIPEPQFILVAQTVVLDLLSILLTFVIVFVLTPILRITELKTRKIIIFWLIFLFVNFLPYVIISKSFSYLESRYYYLASVAWSFIFAWLLSSIFQKVESLLVKFIIMLLFISFLYFHASMIVSDTSQLVRESQIRVRILNQITTLRPTLVDKKNIFYITGDIDYLLPGNNVPFQQGFGYTLMIIYYKSGKLPREFLNDQYLFDLGNEGYKQLNGYGFGYFYNKMELRKVIKENNIPKDSLHAFFYDSKRAEVKDITEEMKAQIYGY